MKRQMSKSYKELQGAGRGEIMRKKRKSNAKQMQDAFLKLHMRKNKIKSESSFQPFQSPSYTRSLGTPCYTTDLPGIACKCSVLLLRVRHQLTCTGPCF